ncbi:MAG: hypothetical protein DSY43_04195 [Gammaproteobacteria bacterium]|nr:MAG: hypothetical protein DSY43_04195 [Gammaproteobacteria bacterium]
MIDIGETRRFTKLMAPEANFDEKYTFYYDETNNIRKFHIKDYDFNAAFTENFVLGGVVHEGDAPNVQSLIDSLGLQATVNEIKLKHLAKGGFLECLKSEKLNLFMSFVKDSSLDIHYSTLNILYWSIIDIVDSAIANSEASQKLGIEFANKLKDDLYKLSRIEIDSVKSLFQKFEYPNIKRNSVLLFIEELSHLFDPYLDDMDFHFGLESLRQILKQSKKSGTLPFVMDGEDFILINDFSQFYLRPTYLFKNSTHIFDNEDTIEKEFQKYKIVDGEVEIKNYSFVDSKTNRLIQLSDILVGLIGKLSGYINTSAKESIYTDCSSLNSVQRQNLGLLLKLIDDSHDKNIGFLHATDSHEEMSKIEVIRACMKRASFGNR